MATSKAYGNSELRKKRHSNAPEEEDLERTLAEIDSYFEENKADFDKWQLEYERYRSDMNEIYLQRDEVFRVEKSISGREYEGLDWSLGQTLGWVAYQKQATFRSLWAADLDPAPTYYGEAYSPVFPSSDPVGALKEELISGKLRGYQDGEPIPSIRWIGSKIWDRPSVKFMRTDVLKIWKELPTAAPPKKPRPSKEKMTEIHEALFAERGRQPSEQEFRDELKKRGFDSNVRRVRAFREEHARETGVSFDPGPRGKRKPPPNQTPSLGKS